LFSPGCFVSIANPTYLISCRQSVSALFCFELTNGRQSRINGSVVRTQQFSLLFHVEPVQIGASFLGFEVCSGISIGCYADTPT